MKYFNNRKSEKIQLIPPFLLLLIGWVSIFFSINVTFFKVEMSLILFVLIVFIAFVFNFIIFFIIDSSFNEIILNEEGIVEKKLWFRKSIKLSDVDRVIEIDIIFDKERNKNFSDKNYLNLFSKNKKIKLGHYLNKYDELKKTLFDRIGIENFVYADHGNGKQEWIKPDKLLKRSKY